MQKDADALRAQGAKAIPADAVTTSGSGLDPDISPANARMQAVRIAAARGAPEAEVLKVIEANVSPPVLGIFGQPTVNVLKTNLALDAALPRGEPPPR
jgi:K+-transporting ATPase ATPase C chain